MKYLYHIYDYSHKFVGFAYNEECANVLAKGHCGYWVIIYSEEFIWS